MTKVTNDIWSGKVMMPPGEQVFKFRNGYHKDWDTTGWEDGEKLKKENNKLNRAVHCVPDTISKVKIELDLNATINTK